MQRYKLTIAYDGSRFHGWQKQAPPRAATMAVGATQAGTGAQPGAGGVADVGGAGRGSGRQIRTVEGVVERAARELLKQPVTVRGASRTDSGVHAAGQVAQLDAATPIPVERLSHALNSRLPDDVDVTRVELAPAGFRVNQNVTTKRYRYVIWNTPRRPLGLRRLVYHYWRELDIERMNAAAAKLVGTHDFAGFAGTRHGRQTTVRTIHRCEVQWFAIHPTAQAATAWEAGDAGERADRPDMTSHEQRSRWGRVNVVAEGDGFLYHMVRIITGTLIDVGRGYFEPERVDAILKAADRRLAGPTAPPQGLCLEWIRYGDD